MEVTESRKNTRLPYSASEQPISIGYLSNLLSTWNSDGMKNGSIATQCAASNGLQGVVPMSNVCMLDHADNGHKTSIHLSTVVSSEGHKIVKHLENRDIMSHEHGKGYSHAKEMLDGKKSIRVLVVCINLMNPPWPFILI